MADVVEKKADEPVVEEKVEKTETVANGEVTEKVAEKTVETPAEKVVEKVIDVPAEKAGEKDATAEAKGNEKKVEAEKSEEKFPEHNDRKRRGSFNDSRGGRGGRGGRGDYNNKRGRGNYSNHNTRSNNLNKSRFEDLPESDDAQEIRRQVDFYFSDSNLPTDKYLLGLTGGHANRPVSLKTIHDFKRMRHFQPYSAVRDAVAASTFLHLSENDEITRKHPLSDRFTDDTRRNKDLAQTASMARSAYIKGFGDETPRTQLDIEEFFEPYGPIAAVRLRRADDGLFKGSAFVEFANEDLQKTFLELDPKPQFADNDLKVMSKQAYVDGKNNDIRDGKVKPRSPDRYHNGGRARNFDRDDWKGRRDYDQRNDAQRGRGRGRGRGAGRGRGGRQQGRDRSRSPRRDRNDERKNDDVLSRAEAEAQRSKKTNGEAAEKVEKNDEEAAVAGAEGGESKKRAREEDAGEGEKGEAKKVKEDAPAAVAES